MRYLVVIACAALCACSSTYHPEYHPVTVTQVSQDLTYPVTVNNGGVPAQQGSAVYITPAQPGAFTMPAPPAPPTPPHGWQTGE